MMCHSAYTYQLSGERDLAMADLQAAIALPPTDKNALKQIYTQRGMLRRLANDDDGALGMTRVTMITRCCSINDLLTLVYR
jgi:hypothetical protein